MPISSRVVTNTQQRVHYLHSQFHSFSDDIYHQVGANFQSSDKVGPDKRQPTVPVTSSIHEELDSAAAFLRNNPFKADTNGSVTVIYPNRLAQPTSMAKTNPQKVR